MARITSQDCIKVVKNRFELVLLAALRARALSSGAQLTVSRRNDRQSVLALREIANNSLNLEEIKEQSMVYYTNSASQVEEETEDDFTESVSSGLLESQGVAEVTETLPAEEQVVLADETDVAGAPAALAAVLAVLAGVSSPE